MDFKANRKMAKQLYNQERLERVKLNKEQYMQQIQQEHDALIKKERKREKQIEEERKQVEKEYKAQKEAH